MRWFPAMFCHARKCFLQDIFKILTDSELQIQISKNELQLKLKLTVHKRSFKSLATCLLLVPTKKAMSTVGVLASRSLHRNLMHSGCRGTAVPKVCLQAFPLFSLPSSPLEDLDRRPVHRLPARTKLRRLRRSGAR